MARHRGKHRRRRSRGSRRRLAALALTVALAVGGLAAIGVAWASQKVAPTPSQAAMHPKPTPDPSVQAAPARQAAPQLVLPRSIPTELSIPAIDVHHHLVRLGRNPDGSIQVPPLSHVDTPGWYKYSPTPGQVGPAVILGHIDSAAEGEGVFFRLGALKPGEKVLVTRADHTVAVFTIDRLGLYSKSHFPTVEVYGNTSDPQLRLITCGGAFNQSAGSYVDNTVVYAHLTGTRHAGTS